MKREYSIYAMIGLLLAATGTSVLAMAGTANNLQKQFLARIDELLPGMGAEKLVDREKPQMTFERLCFENSGPDKQAERAALCAAMIERVGPKVAMPARVWLLRKVESIGREEVVRGLAKLLHDSDPQIRELARRALQNNPAPSAGAALRKELDAAKDSPWRVALINALAFRRDREAVSRISSLAADNDEAVATAAIAALGSIADDQAIGALASLRKKAPAKVQGEVVDASLRAADALVARDDKLRAASIYEEMVAPSTPEPVRIAAIRGITAAKGPEAVPELLKLIAGNDEHMQIVAGRCAQDIPGQEVTKQLVNALADASPGAQTVLLDVLGKRGDAAALPAVLKLVGASAPEVRLAAIGALRYLGNGSTVETLAAFAAKTTGSERDAARDGLKWMPGQDVDDAILKLIPTAEDRVKAELVRAAAERVMKPAFEILLQNTRDSDESVRVSVVSNIGKLAHLQDLPKVVKSFEKLEGDQTRETARDALWRICTRVTDADQKAKPLIDLMPSAEPSVQVLIVQALVMLRGQAALEAIRKCQESDNAEVKNAAAKALADWGPAYCTQWVYAGPYKKEGAKFTDLFDAVFAPEDPRAAVQWKPLEVGKKDKAQIDLEPLGKDENCCVYMKTRAWSDKDQDVVLTFGSDDGVKAWLNGAVAHANNATRGFKLDEDQAPAKLKQGWNTLLVKITQGSGGWSFSCGIKVPQGGPPPGLKFEAQ